MVLEHWSTIRKTKALKATKALGSKKLQQSPKQNKNQKIWLHTRKSTKEPAKKPSSRETVLISFPPQKEKSQISNQITETVPERSVPENQIMLQQMKELTEILNASLPVLVQFDWKIILNFLTNLYAFGLGSAIICTCAVHHPTIHFILWYIQICLDLY